MGALHLRMRDGFGQADAKRVSGGTGQTPPPEDPIGSRRGRVDELVELVLAERDGRRPHRQLMHEGRPQAVVEVLARALGDALGARLRSGAHAWTSSTTRPR